MFFLKLISLVICFLSSIVKKRGSLGGSEFFEHSTSIPLIKSADGMIKGGAGSYRKQL